jgi:hypothetical protein
MSNDDGIYFVNEKPKRNKHGEFIFKDDPDFKPNRSPREMLKAGVFGGTYFRKIRSKVLNETLENDWKDFPKEIFKGIPKEYFLTPYKEYNKDINKYKVKVGTTLEFWESKGWMTEYDPRGWYSWWCCYFYGRRCPDDARQIRRWKNFASPNRGRFFIWLCNKLIENNAHYNDCTISPKMCQNLLEWSGELTPYRFSEYKKKKRSKKKNSHK